MHHQYNNSNHDGNWHLIQQLHIQYYQKHQNQAQTKWCITTESSSNKWISKIYNEISGKEGSKKIINIINGLIFNK